MSIFALPLFGFGRVVLIGFAFLPFGIVDCSSVMIDSSGDDGLSIFKRFCICFFNDGRLDLLFDVVVVGGDGFDSFVN